MNQYGRCLMLSLFVSVLVSFHRVCNTIQVGVECIDKFVPGPVSGTSAWSGQSPSLVYTYVFRYSSIFSYVCQYANILHVLGSQTIDQINFQNSHTMQSLRTYNKMESEYLMYNRIILHDRLCLEPGGYLCNQHRTLTSCDQGWMRRTFWDVGR